MTKYILVGGSSTTTPIEAGERLNKALVEGLQEPYRILICCFARSEESWQEIFEKYKKLFVQFFPDKKVDFQLADPDNFIEQVKWTQVLYLLGGSAEQLLQDLLHRNSEWTKYIDGKTVAGSSAGADVLAKYYYLLDTPGVAQGLGIVPVKIIAHYRSDYNAPNIDWDKAYQELKEHGEDLPILTLKEGQFEIIRQ